MKSSKCYTFSIRDLEDIWLRQKERGKADFDYDGCSSPGHKKISPYDTEKKLTEQEENDRKNKLWSNRRLKPSEVALHNTAEDCWLSWNGTVRDLTPVISLYKGSEMADVILADAGKDVSHWFDKEGNLRGYMSKLSGTKIPFLPRGAMLGTYVEVYPSGLHPIFPGKSWWKNNDYIVGHLTSNPRQIAITNTLAVRTANITVCEEDTMEVILMRYISFNENAENYTWKYDGKILDMKKTLAENKVPDYAQRFRKLGLPEDTYIPNILLYFNDDI